MKPFLSLLLLLANGVSVGYGYSKDIDVKRIFGDRASTDSDIYVIIGVGVIVLCFLIYVVYHKRSSRRELRESQERYQKRKEEAKLLKLEVSAEGLEAIQAISRATNRTTEDLLSSNSLFESAVTLIQEQDPDDPLLDQIPTLRDELGYVFFNRRMPFISSKMLQTGQKIRVAVLFKGRSHSYVGAILNTTENELWLQPPTVKGSTVDLTKFRNIDVSVFRKDDGEYRFSCPMKTQISEPVHAVVVGHSTKIKKLHTREYERYSLQFERKFYFILGRSKTDSGKMTGVSLMGLVDDISLGGMKFFADKLPPQAQVGTTVIFYLKEAKIKKEIQGKVVRIGQAGEGKVSVHLQFQGLSELNRLHLQKFIASQNPTKLSPY